MTHDQTPKCMCDEGYVHTAWSHIKCPSHSSSSSTHSSTYLGLDTNLFLHCSIFRVQSLEVVTVLIRIFKQVLEVPQPDLTQPAQTNTDYLPTGLLTCKERTCG